MQCVAGNSARSPRVLATLLVGRPAPDPANRRGRWQGVSWPTLEDGHERRRERGSYSERCPPDRYGEHDGVAGVLVTATRTPPRLRRTSLRALIAALAVVTALGSCGGPGEEQLRDGARSLLPSGSSIVDEVTEDCVELAPSPSCVHVYFVTSHVDQDARVTSVVQAAEASDWALDSREVLPGGVLLRFHTQDLKAFVSLENNDRAKQCALNPSKACADVVMVEGIYGT
jgi:hypothetical protein